MLGVFAGSGVGKSALLGMIARATQARVNVIALIGERGREVREFIERDPGPEGLARSVVVVATSDQPPLVRVRGAFLATAIAEYFRDRGADVMLMMDSLTRLAIKCRRSSPLPTLRCCKAWRPTCGPRTGTVKSSNAGRMSLPSMPRKRRCSVWRSILAPQTSPAFWSI